MPAEPTPANQPLGSPKWVGQQDWPSAPVAFERRHMREQWMVTHTEPPHGCHSTQASQKSPLYWTLCSHHLLWEALPVYSRHHHPCRLCLLAPLADVIWYKQLLCQGLLSSTPGRTGARAHDFGCHHPASRAQQTAGASKGIC